MADEKNETDSKGIPLKSEMPDFPPVWIFYTVMNIVFGCVGFAIAWFAAYAREAKITKADAQILLIKQFDLGWLYLGVFVLRTLQLPLSVALGQARKDSKIALPDQHVYKVMGAEGSKLGYVLMETEGALGDFNRAQRALMNYHENFPTIVLQYLVASFVFPFESFICISLWAVSRCMGAAGYKGSVKGRMNGMLPGIVSMFVLQGMIIIVALKALK